MRIDARAFGLAAGVTAAVLAALCRLAFMLAPSAAVRAAGSLVHSDWSALARVPTIGTLIIGVVAWGVGAGITFAIGASLYNQLASGSLHGTAPQSS